MFDRIHNPVSFAVAYQAPCVGQPIRSVQLALTFYLMGPTYQWIGCREHGTPWMWTIVFHESADHPGPHQGFAVNREEAMAAFCAAWKQRMAT